MKLLLGLRSPRMRECKLISGENSFAFCVRSSIDKLAKAAGDLLHVALNIQATV